MRIKKHIWGNIRQAKFEEHYILQKCHKCWAYCQINGHERYDNNIVLDLGMHHALIKNIYLKGNTDIITKIWFWTIYRISVSGAEFPEFGDFIGVL